MTAPAQPLPSPAGEFAAFRAHPALPGAVAEFGGWLIRNYDGNALLNMLMCDRGRILVGLFVTYLDVLPLPGRADVGATLGGVQALCQQTGLCSHGRAASLLAAMRFGGYLALAADRADRRRRLLRPTAKLRDMQDSNWSRQFAAMAQMVPEAASFPEALRRPAFRTAFIHALGTRFFGGYRLLDEVAVLAPLVESNAGLLVLVNLVLPVLKGEAAAGVSVAVSVSALSRRFCIARAHVRNLLQGAREAGLLAAAPEPERIVVLPALADAVLSFYAALFALFHRCATVAAHEEWRWAAGVIYPVNASPEPGAAAVWPAERRQGGTDAVTATKGDGGGAHGDALSGAPGPHPGRGAGADNRAT